jgi:hypothetical protein
LTQCETARLYKILTLNFDVIVLLKPKNMD